MSFKESIVQTVTESKLWGPFLIALASFLWATDALVRIPAVGALDPIWIVLCEHAIGASALGLILVLRGTIGLFSLSLKEWMAAAFVGILGSALATVFFTASFQYANPSVVILLIKLQQVMVIFLARIFLKEKPSPLLYVLGFVALVAAVVLSFPNFQFGFIENASDAHSKGIFYALLAAALWAGSTIAGKRLMMKATPVIATFWRFVFGLVALLFLAFFANAPVPELSVIGTSKVIFFLGYMALIPGILGMILYYAGMRRTSASITTFAELTFPVSAVALNTMVLNMPLTQVQLIAGAILIGSVTLISVSTPTNG